MEGSVCLSSAALVSALSSLAVTLLRQRHLPSNNVEAVAAPLVGRQPVQPVRLVQPALPELIVDAPRMRRSSLVEDSPRRRLRVAAEAVEAANFQGFSMEEARQKNAIHAARHKELTPTEVLAELQRGNARFWTGSSHRPESSAFERRALIMSQFPTVALLGCADSRVPAEIVFDQGLGDMFVVRVAGNCLDMTTHGSLLYAVNHLHVKVLMVMGHEFCGAVKAAGLPTHQLEKEPALLCKTLKMLKAGLDEDRLRNVLDARAHDREAVVTNVKRQIEQLMQDEHISKKVRNKELIVVGAFYEISSGIVDFFLEITQ